MCSLIWRPKYDAVDSVKMYFSPTKIIKFHIVRKNSRISGWISWIRSHWISGFYISHTYIRYKISTLCISNCFCPNSNIIDPSTTKNEKFADFRETSTWYAEWILAYRSPFQLAPLSLGASRWSSNPCLLIGCPLPPDRGETVHQRSEAKRGKMDLGYCVGFGFEELGWVDCYCTVQTRDFHIRWWVHKG